MGKTIQLIIFEFILAIIFSFVIFLKIKLKEIFLPSVWVTVIIWLVLAIAILLGVKYKLLRYD